MPSKKIQFVVAIAFQVLVIFAIILFKVSVLVGGTEVMLKIAPVDPTDLLRGDYVTFQYDISNLSSRLIKGESVINGDEVYVTLAPAGKYWIAKAVQKTRPTGNDLFIKGVVQSGGVESQGYETSRIQRSRGVQLHVVYGAEQYFVPEGSARDISFWRKESTAKVSIDESGNAALKQVYVEGKPLP